MSQREEIISQLVRTESAVYEGFGFKEMSVKMLAELLRSSRQREDG